MKKIIAGLVVLLVSMATFAQSESFYSFTTTTIDGKPYPFSQLKGKKVLIVNVDVQDQLAPQYAILEELYSQYCDSNFVLLGFPTEDFDTQSAKQQAQTNGYRLLDYDVTFPVMEKTSVVGKNISPLYKWLTEKKLNGKQNAPVTGNFQKFMIDEKGQWVGVLPPDDSAFNLKILNWVQGGN